MRVDRLTSVDQLAPLAQTWNRLARGVPFRSWEWLSSWWHHYGRQGDLYVLTVHDVQGNLMGLAPWYRQLRGRWGHVLQFLGSGDACSDYMTVLSTFHDEEKVVEAIAAWLLRNANGSGTVVSELDNRWDLLELIGVDAMDRPIRLLADTLRKRGLAVHQRAGLSCWRIELPSTWDEYLACLSKNRRKQLRRSQKLLTAAAAKRLTAHQVRTRSELEAVWDSFLTLHRRRRESLGDSGCFVRPGFEPFLREATERLLDGGRVLMPWVAHGTRPVAFELHLIGDEVTYAYQSAMDPDMSEGGPGNLTSALAIQHAIERGLHACDLLRGDEAYKVRWHAKRRETVETRVAAPTVSARLRHGVWRTGSLVKKWARGGLQRFVAG